MEKGKQKNVRSWYQSRALVEKVKSEARIKDFHTEIMENMKSTDLIDFEKFLICMVHSNCTYASINLSYCRIRMKLVKRTPNRFSSLYQIEILDKYIAAAYIDSVIPFREIYNLVRSVVDTMETNGL